MESRFNKYESNGQAMSSHIANVNSFIDMLYTKGNDMIEKEIQSLNYQIEKGNAPVIFSNKVKLLIALGKCIEQVYDTYHFNRDNAVA